MKKAMNNSPTLTWREVVDKHHSGMVDELTGTLDSLFQAERLAAAAETERTRIATAEALNQILRRLRNTESDSALYDLLAEATSNYADRVVVLTLENNQAQAYAVARRAIDEGDLTFDTAKAAAFGAAIESKDPVTSVLAPSEVSAELATAFGGGDAKLYLFPLVARLEVIGVLVASGNVLPGALELLSGAAGLKLESLRPEVPVLKPLPSTEFVQIGLPAVAASGSAPERRAWTDLSADDQKLHLQAQRVARVKVAEMRLYHAEDLRRGVESRDVYGALRELIDDARNAFLRAFLSKSATMVDYLHLELLRSLAHDDDRLLGETYPGPMV